MTTLEIFIPARSGSTRVKNKNLKKIGKMSLLEKKIKTCKIASNAKIIVSTNSKKIASKARILGAIVPYIRPKKYSTSKASTISAILDYLRFLKKKGSKLPDFLAILPVTNPFLKSETIKKAIKLAKLSVRRKKINSVISYSTSDEHPFLYVITGKKIKFNLFKYKGYTYSDLERTQDWPKAYVASAALKITKSKYFEKYINNKSANFQLKSFDLNNSVGIQISKREDFDINDESDLKLGNFFLKN